MKDFIKFITEDYIMLGLCVAIIVLFIIFLIVLIFGSKKKSNDKTESNNDNTKKIIENSAIDEPLRSTQEFQINTESKGLEDNKGSDDNVIIIPEMPVHEEPDIPIPVETENNPISLDIPKNEASANAEPLNTMSSNSYSNQISLDGEVSDTEIIRQISDMNPEQVNEPTRSIPAIEPVEEDDVELPKLNTNQDNSVLDILKGEAYEINK